ncbi:aldose epimerase family protein [Enterococcus sp. BWR-S5]|uniref:aldose epimerase family protein n=1 Tax=Enterococcus sp. BWR-S5 TaxID=2787714 RepID=UPI001922538D|nr:aldose epimerase family protein [Enterococcus sp. BWR-S5]MBL1223489.1 galactose mutarotase [Enterococcus sp. BWR-S5]
MSTIKISKADFSIELFNYGASVTALYLPRRTGKLENVILRFPDKQRYLAERSFLGASVGRCAGRIAGGVYPLFKQQLQLEKNEGENHLHGGSKGFNTVCWSYEISQEEGAVTVVFSHTFEDGANGYPGNLSMTISYTIFSDKRVKISYQGLSDKDTLLNPTNHTYFNLSGGADATVAKHYLKIPSERFALLDQAHVPSFPLAVSTQTIFDMNQPILLRDIFDSKNHQIVQEKGLNHPFFLKREAHSAQLPIELWHPESGRRLSIQTSNSFVICYTGNHFETGKEPAFHGGIALETQELYQAMSESKTGQEIKLKRGQIFSSWTEWTFGLLDDSV